MELKIKKIFFKSYILNTENQTEFIIKKNLKTYGEYSVCNNIGEIVYSVKIARQTHKIRLYRTRNTKRILRVGRLQMERHRNKRLCFKEALRYFRNTPD